MTLAERIAALVDAGYVFNFCRAAIDASDSRNSYHSVAFVHYDGPTSIERAVALVEHHSFNDADENRALGAIVQGEV